MKPTFAKPFIAVIGAVFLSATLFGCTPTITPEEELVSLERNVSHIGSHEYASIKLGDTVQGEGYQLVFDSYGWTGAYLPLTARRSINFYVKGSFTNLSDTVYRPEDSIESNIEFDGDHRLLGVIMVVENGVARNGKDVYPGETVELLIRTPIPTPMRDAFKSAAVAMTLHSSDSLNGVYTTHSSESIGEYILGITLKDNQ